MDTRNENPDFSCSRYFGYLSQRSKRKVTPDECLICKKLLDCKLEKPNTTTHRKASKRKASKKKTSGMKTSRTADIEEVKQSAEDPAVYVAINDLEMIKYEDETKPPTILFPPHNLKVENLGNPNKSWPETVFIDRETFSGWGGRFTEVNIQTNVGKELRCKVMPSGNSRKGTILVPKKIQLELEIKQGELVSVEPSILLVPENKTNDIVQTFYGFKKR